MKQFCGQSKNSYRSKVIQVANTPTTKTRFTLYSSLKSVYIDATKVNWTQWRSKALRGPDSTVTCRGRGEGVSCFGSKGYSWKPEVLRAGWCFGKGLLPGLGSGVSSPSGVPSRQEFWCFLWSQMTCSATENSACTVQVCHFTSHIFEKQAYYFLA